jgi:hypothetical protein
LQTKGEKLTNKTVIKPLLQHRVWRKPGPYWPLYSICILVSLGRCLHLICRPAPSPNVSCNYFRTHQYMPFTFSHPAIILPLASKRLKLSATALIIGSMTPDFEYFIRMKVQSNYSHTLLGLFWFDLPLGIILCFIYQSIVRNSFIANSPAFIQKRLNKFKPFNWTQYYLSNWFIVCISIIVGAFSHLLWDSFTHETGYFVERSSVLNESLHLNGLTLPIYKVVQRLSTLIGGLITVIAFLTIEKTKIQTTGSIYKYWLLIVLITLIIIFLRLSFGLQLNEYGNIIVTMTSAAFASLILTPLILRKNNYS